MFVLDLIFIVFRKEYLVIISVVETFETGYDVVENGGFCYCMPHYIFPSIKAKKFATPFQFSSCTHINLPHCAVRHGV